MTKTELLALSERLDDAPGVLGMLSRTDLAEAAALLRKLAELRPVAWIWRYANGEEEVVFVDPARVNFDPDVMDVPSQVTPLYQLSEVLTDD